MKNILIIEPNYKNKYPPLGLMKISTYHKEKGDRVTFIKGFSNELKEKIWDRIYISSLFTFHWNITLKTIKYYSNSVKKLSDIYIGGVMATLMKDKIENEFKINVVEGLLNQKGKLGYKDDDKIDFLTPDYSIVDCKENKLLKYEYPLSNSYIAYATRGCIRKCPFCAVPIIEGVFNNGLSIKKQVEAIKKKYGVKKDLVLLDNNVLAAKDNFETIINEIKEIGFSKDEKFEYILNGKVKKRNKYVDFNQGIDSRLLNRANMKLLSEISIHPLRIAFDSIKYEKIYIEKVRLAAEFGIKNLSNYILFNYNDTPEDYYRRLQINIELNEEFDKKGYDTKIWSFPMKFSPIFGKDAIKRSHISPSWNKKLLRGLQCIMIPTHGVVGPRREYFESAYGKDYNEFIKILLLPEDYIIHRNRHIQNKNRKKLDNQFEKLSKKEKNGVLNIIVENKYNDLDMQKYNMVQEKIINIYKTNNKFIPEET